MIAEGGFRKYCAICQFHFPKPTTLRRHQRRQHPEIYGETSDGRTGPDHPDAHCKDGPEGGAIGGELEEPTTRFLAEKQEREHETTMNLLMQMTQVMTNVVQAIGVLDQDRRVPVQGQAENPPMPRNRGFHGVPRLPPVRRCYNCGEKRHIASDCPKPWSPDGRRSNILVAPPHLECEICGGHHPTGGEGCLHKGDDMKVSAGRQSRDLTTL